MNAGRVVLAIGCGYEIVALLTRRVPTITALVRRMGNGSPIGRVVVWSWCGFIAWHFMEPLPDA